MYNYDSQIRLFKGVPFTSSYEHTLYGENQTAKLNWLVREYEHKDVFNELMEIKFNEGTFRLTMSYWESLEFNYCMIRNDPTTEASLKDNYIFAFIDNVTYINDNCIEFNFTIDVMMTYSHKLVMKPCYIERQHSETDAIGDNLVGEPIEDFEYMYTKCNSEAQKIWNVTNESHTSSDFSIAIVWGGSWRSEVGGDVVSPYWANGYPNMSITFAYPCTNTGLFHLYNFCDTASLDNVIYAYLIPTSLLRFGSSDSDILIGPTLNTYRIDGQYVVTGISPLMNNIKALKPTTTMRFDNYVNGNQTTYINRKLYTSPFTTLSIDFGKESSEYQFDYFDTTGDDYVNFRILGSVTYPPVITLLPYGYKTASNLFNYEHAVSDSSLPMVQLTGDAFKQWLANGGLVNSFGKGIGMVASTMAGVASAGASAKILPGMAAEVSNIRQGGGWVHRGKNGKFTSNAPANKQAYRIEEARTNAYAELGATRELYSASANVVNDIGSLIGRINDPVNVKAGKLDNNNPLLTTGNYGIRSFYKTPTKQYAKIIDDFFTRYGYSQNKISVPNFNARPLFTYIKTRDANFSCARCCGDVISRINDIINKGITFWTTTNNHNNILTYDGVGNRP